MINLPRVIEWYAEWRPYSDLPRWRLWVWSFVAAHYWPRRFRRLWGWWVDVYVPMHVTRRRIERRLEDVRSAVGNYPQSSGGRASRVARYGEPHATGSAGAPSRPGA